MTSIAVLGYRLSGVRSGAHLAHLELAGYLAASGHQVEYAALRGGQRTRFDEPVHVGAGAVRSVVAGADSVLLRDEPGVARLLGHVAGRPALYVCHSPAGDPRELGIRLPNGTTLVWVSASLRDQAAERHGPYRGENVVIEGCPIDASRYRTTPGSRITLVNLSLRKGGALFWELAGRMPERKFLGVCGWGEQLLPSEIPANVRLMPSVHDPRSFYRETRVILLPSAEAGTVEASKLPAWGEAWNRVGVEAAASGIPAIAHPARGIRASLGKAAVYVDRDDLEEWVRTIRRFDDPGFYAERSAAALERAREVDAMREGIVDAYERLLEAA